MVTWEPTGSRSPKRVSATAEPSTATRRATSTSERDRYVPRAMSRTNTFGVVSSTPLTLVNRLRVPARTVSPDEVATATRLRSPTIRVTASTSSRRSRETVGAAPKSTRPGTMSSRLEPSPSTCCSTVCLAPVPIATRITTAATPMMTPSIVSPLRSRLARSASTRHPPRLGEASRVLGPR